MLELGQAGTAGGAKGHVLVLRDGEMGAAVIGGKC